MISECRVQSAEWAQTWVELWTFFTSPSFLKVRKFLPLGGSRNHKFKVKMAELSPIASERVSKQSDQGICAGTVASKGVLKPQDEGGEAEAFICCDQCQESFPSKSAAKNHRRKYCNKVVEVISLCDICLVGIARCTQIHWFKVAHENTADRCDISSSPDKKLANWPKGSGSALLCLRPLVLIISLPFIFSKPDIKRVPRPLLHQFIEWWNS